MVDEILKSVLHIESMLETWLPVMAGILACILLIKLLEH